MIPVPARLRRRLPTLAVTILLLATAGEAMAQVGSPGQFPSGPAGGGPQEAPKKEGVAIAAPKTPGLLPTTPTLPPARSGRKKLQLFELGGYLRLRTDWFKDFNLGFRDDRDGGAPFKRPSGCSIAGAPCDDTLGSANMRLRLEPVINVSETASVHFQIDALDNLVLGSTADGIYPSSVQPQAGSVPTGAFGETQIPPQQGLNDTRDAIRIKRAWAEVATPLGIFKFGRMPDHWGLGMVHNAGSEDPINGGYDLDSDYGDSVDRVSFSTLIPSTRLRAAAALDWPMSGLNSGQSGLAYVGGGQPFDLDDSDDVTQYSLIVSRMDAPTDFRDTLDRGELALNYGAYVNYRTQKYERVLDTNADPLGALTMSRVDYKTYVPDLWLKLGYGNFLFEAEAATVVGSMRRPDPKNPGDIDLRQMGAIGRFTYRAVDDQLHTGVELGYASGDQWDNDPPGEINIASSRGLPGLGDKNSTQFLFDRNYRVDQILFRELVGAVTNTIYGKPFINYDITKGFYVGASNVTSFAARKVATPGNKSPLGIELDATAGYRGESFFAGVTYGLLLPLSGLSHPANPDETATENPYGFGEGNTGDPHNAHAIRATFAVRF